MMRAIVNGIEVRLFQVALQLLVNLDDYVLGKITPRHARLVRHQNRQPLVVIQNPDRYRLIRKQAKP